MIYQMPKFWLITIKATTPLRPSYKNFLGDHAPKPPLPSWKFFTLALDISTCGTNGANGASLPAEPLHPVPPNATKNPDVHCM